VSSRDLSTISTEPQLVFEYEEKLVVGPSSSDEMIKSSSCYNCVLFLQDFS